MEWLRRLAVNIGVVWLFCLAALVALRMLNGEIATRGLLRTKTGGRLGSVSPERVQLLLITLAAAATYANRVIQSRSTGRLPEFDNVWLGLLGASNSTFLVTKLLRLLASNSNRH